MKFEVYASKPGAPLVHRFEFDNVTNSVKLTGKNTVLLNSTTFEELYGENPRFRKHESALAFSSTDYAFKQRHSRSIVTSMPEEERYSYENPILGKSKEVSKLRIQLGLACNYQCRYCLQASHRDQAIKVSGIEKVETFLRKIDKAGIRLTEHGMIDLWGGEPLVYWKTIKHLVPRLREKYGYEVDISIFTNGVLLKEEIINFLLDYRVKVQISHDGSGFSLRNQADPLFNPSVKKQWLDLYRKSIDIGIPMTFFSVIQPGNCDLFALRAYFQSNFSPDIHFDFGGAASETEFLPNECLIREKEGEILRQSMLRAVVEEPGVWKGLERRVFNLMGRLIHQVPVTGIRYHCNAVDEAVLCVDLNGVVLSCQNRPAASHSIGHLDQFEEISNPYFLHWSYRRICKDCLVLSSCKGGCPDLSNVAFERCCQNEWFFHFGIFTVAWYLLTGTIIKSISPRPSFLKEPVIPLVKVFDGS